MQFMGINLLNYSVTTIIAFILFCYILVSACAALYSITFHPLAKFPGPRLRAYSAFPYISDLFRGTSVAKIHALHEKYGPVVRISPDALSFNTPQAWKDIYGFRPGKKQIPKDYARFPDVPDTLQILVSDDITHARLRRCLAHAFSETALQEQAPILKTRVTELINQLKLQFGRSSQVKIDLNMWYTLLAFDVVTDLSFGEPLHAVAGAQKHPFIEGFFASCRMYPMIPLSHAYASIGLLMKLMLKIPAFKKVSEEGYMATEEKVQKRIAMKSPDRKDFITCILRHNDERGMTEKEIIGSTGVIVNGGGESVAVCTTTATFYMLRNPEILKKAQKEVRDAFIEQDRITIRATAKLTYLNAIIEEALRINPPTPGNFSRRTSASGEIFDGYFVPPNTSIGVHQWSANHSAKNFHSPETFVPERWLAEPPEEYRNDIKAASQPWSIGPRNCLGKNIAYAEIRLTLAYLLWNFDMELCSDSESWATNQRYDITWDRPSMFVELSRREGENIMRP